MKTNTVCSRALNGAHVFFEKAKKKKHVEGLGSLTKLLTEGFAAAEAFSVQRFTEIWLSMRSRTFDDDGYGFIVPLACLMNHPSMGDESNVALSYDARRGGVVMRAKRRISKGEELTYSYGSGLCRERALLVYGFVLDGMPACKGM